MQDMKDGEKIFCPYSLRNDFEENMKIAVELVETKGLTPRDACLLTYGILQRQWNRWLVQSRKLQEKGVRPKESKLLTLLTNLAKADLTLKQKLEGASVEIALDGNPEMLKFLLERRYGYTKQSKKSVDVSSDKENSFEIKIVNSKSDK